jgi:hypothetical protein
MSTVFRVSNPTTINPRAVAEDDVCLHRVLCDANCEPFRKVR